jgi:hypothetical protein
MPDIAPQIEGLEVAGKCLSANTVSGDFFDYLSLAPNGSKIAIVVGDVTGHGMQGAMNAVMTDGMLHTNHRGRNRYPLRRDTAWQTQQLSQTEDGSWNERHDGHRTYQR